MPENFSRILLFILVVQLWGCSTFQKDLAEPTALMRSGNPQKAAELLKEKAFKDGDDQLVYLLEYGIAQHLAQDYKESNRAFLKADKLSEIQDYHSISRIGSSLLLNEGMVQYKGDDFEKVMINAYLAINYLMMGELDEANVEARRLNEKLYKYKYEAKLDFEQSALAFYLSAMIWEANKNYESALIDYKKVYALDPGFSYIKEDLLRSSYLAQRRDEFDKYKSKFTEIKTDVATYKDKQLGEVILIYQQGLGPIKRPNPSFVRVPKLFPRPTSTQKAELQIGFSGNVVTSSSTQTLYNVQDIAIKTLDDQYAGLVAKRVAGFVAKEVAADQIRQKNELLGAIAWIGLHASDQADLRQWSMLPQTFQIARVKLNPGTYEVNIDGKTDSGTPSGPHYKGVVTVQAGKKSFLNWRSF